jgi:hypothetical protein
LYLNLKLSLSMLMIIEPSTIRSSVATVSTRRRRLANC